MIETKRTGLPAKAAASSFQCGRAPIQGTHQVDQNSTTTAWPRSASGARSAGEPPWTTASTLSAGAGLSGLDAPGLARGARPRPPPSPRPERAPRGAPERRRAGARSDGCIFGIRGSYRAGRGRRPALLSPPAHRSKFSPPISSEELQPMIRRCLVLSLLAALGLTGAAAATTYVLGTDEQLADQAAVVLDGTVEEVGGGRRRRRGRLTEYRVRVERPCSRGGSPAARCGCASSAASARDGMRFHVWGVPALRDGRADAPLPGAARGRRVTVRSTSAWGSSARRASSGRALALRDLSGGAGARPRRAARRVERTRDFAGFGRWVADRAAGAPAAAGLLRRAAGRPGQGDRALHLPRRAEASLVRVRQRADRRLAGPPGRAAGGRRRRLRRVPGGDRTPGTTTPAPTSATATTAPPRHRTASRTSTASTPSSSRTPTTRSAAPSPAPSPATARASWRSAAPGRTTSR